jgi:hypothetical protein
MHKPFSCHTTNAFETTVNKSCDNGVVKFELR